MPFEESRYIACQARPVERPGNSDHMLILAELLKVMSHPKKARREKISDGNGHTATLLHLTKID
jgi:hypothetical protein